MRHRKAGRKFGRSSDQRKALTRCQINALLLHGRITTTEAKAKELKRWVERVITLAKPGDVHAHRQASLWVSDREAHKRLFGTYVGRYHDRPGGYTRIYHVGARPGDAAPMAIIEFVEAHVEPVVAAAPARGARTRAKRPSGSAGSGGATSDTSGSRTATPAAKSRVAE